MTTKEKAKAYDEAFEIAKKNYNATQDLCKGSQIGVECFKNTLANIFPELKESEDERIRKELITHCRNTRCVTEEWAEKIAKWIAWLEKQGELDDNIINRDDEILQAISVGLTDVVEDVGWSDFGGIPIEEIQDWLEKQGDKSQGKSALEAIKEEKVDNRNYVKPADNVEPKFKNGQWIVWKDKCYIVNYNGCGYELIDQNGLSTSLEYGTIDENAHLWDITKDAKSGDLIYVSTEEKGIQAIFDEFDNGIIYFHCSLCSDFTQGGYMPMGDVELVYPLQKKHYQRFFHLLKESGYEWDAEKKELKRIESEIEIPFGAKDSELQVVAYYIPKGFHAEIDDHKVVIKKGEKPTAWSEEDEKRFTKTLYLLDAGFNNFKCTDGISESKEWLKSLKQRITCML